MTSNGKPSFAQPYQEMEKEEDPTKFTPMNCLRAWCCCFFGCPELDNYPDDAEMAMRNKVTVAARENDFKGLKKAIAAIEKTYKNPEKTKAACNMWDAESGREAVLFMTSLKWAAEHGNIEMCKLLMENGANLHCSMYADPLSRGKFKSPGGVQPLGQAAMCGKLECVKFLIEAGANPNYRNFLGQSAADLAGQTGAAECQKYLKSVMK